MICLHHPEGMLCLATLFLYHPFLYHPFHRSGLQDIALSVQHFAVEQGHTDLTLGWWVIHFNVEYYLRELILGLTHGVVKDHLISFTPVILEALLWLLPPSETRQWQPEKQIYFFRHSTRALKSLCHYWCLPPVGEGFLFFFFFFGIS